MAQCFFHMSYVFYAWILGCISPFFLLDVTGLSGAAAACRGVTWVCMCAFLWLISSVGIGAIWDLFPVPLSHLITTRFIAPVFPLLYFIAPVTQRTSRAVRHRMLFGTLAVVAILN